MSRTTSLMMVDGTRVVVTESLHQITPYVLEEQGDWFEDEIRFVRRLLKPGQRAIDIGANHGVYALSMAKAVGAGGRVWAFEPASAVARLLEQSIALNGFDQLKLRGEAMSNQVGIAEMSVSSNSELNTLVLSSNPTGATETVALTTLDACMVLYEWEGVAFLKIDAEGEEERILQGGRRFLAEFSPLVLYEIRAGSELKMGLIDSFAELGYRSYRLVPGLGLLMPVDPATKLDDFVLNLFACKPSRARQLAEEGLLVEEEGPVSTDTADLASWRTCLSVLPYGQRLATLWDRTVASGQSDDVTQALSLHACSRDASKTAPVRLAALRRSLELLLIASGKTNAYLRLASLARIAAEFGERSAAHAALSRLCDELAKRRDIGPAEPFLAPSARFDQIAPGDAIGNWVLAAAMEERERLGAHSSYFSGDASWNALKSIAALGYASDEMQRRLKLVQKRFVKSDSPVSQ